MDGNYKKEWKKKNRDKVQKSKKRYYDRTAFALNHRMNYSEKEIQMILDHNITDTEIAKKTGRSVMAIQIKRSRLQKKGEMV